MPRDPWPLDRQRLPGCLQSADARGSVYEVLNFVQRAQVLHKWCTPRLWDWGISIQRVHEADAHFGTGVHSRFNFISQGFCCITLHFIQADSTNQSCHLPSLSSCVNIRLCWSVSIGLRWSVHQLLCLHHSLVHLPPSNRIKNQQSTKSSKHTAARAQPAAVGNIDQDFEARAGPVH